MLVGEVSEEIEESTELFDDSLYIFKTFSIRLPTVLIGPLSSFSSLDKLDINFLELLNVPIAFFTAVLSTSDMFLELNIVGADSAKNLSKY